MTFKRKLSQDCRHTVEANEILPGRYMLRDNRELLAGNEISDEARKHVKPWELVKLGRVFNEIRGAGDTPDEALEDMRHRQGVAKAVSFENGKQNGELGSVWKEDGVWKVQFPHGILAFRTKVEAAKISDGFFKKEA